MRRLGQVLQASGLPGVASLCGAGAASGVTASGMGGGWAATHAWVPPTAEIVGTLHRVYVSQMREPLKKQRHII